MANGTYSIGALRAASGVSARHVKYWIEKGLVPPPVGTGRGARYTEKHLLLLRVVAHLRSTDLSLDVIAKRVSGASEAQLRAMVPTTGRLTTPEGVPLPPPIPAYPSSTWQLVPLMDGMFLMVDPAKGELLRRIAGEIHRNYGVTRVTSS